MCAGGTSGAEGKSHCSAAESRGALEERVRAELGLLEELHQNCALIQTGVPAGGELRVYFLKTYGIKVNLF